MPYLENCSLLDLPEVDKSRIQSGIQFSSPCLIHWQGESATFRTVISSGSSSYPVGLLFEFNGAGYRNYGFADKPSCSIKQVFINFFLYKGDLSLSFPVSKHYKTDPAEVSYLMDPYLPDGTFLLLSTFSGLTSAV